MKNDTHQGIAKDHPRRSLKVEATGDFFLGKTKPQIRLCGYWLQRAGFQPGSRVEVQSDHPGILTLRQLEKTKGFAS